MLTKISTLLRHQGGRDACSLPPSATVHEAVRTMTEKRAEAVLIVSNGRLVGIVTERDCARRVTLQGRDPQSVFVSEVMTSPVVFVTAAHTVGDCMKILTEKGFAHLPVLDGETVVGMLSMADLASSMVREHGDTIKHLEGYITGRYPG